MAPTHLPPIDDDGGADHPDDLTVAEARAGQLVYFAVDDLDDESTGLEDDPQ